MTEKKIIVTANLIKFGIPAGIVLGVGNFFSALVLRADGVSADAIGQSLMLLMMGVAGGAVLGLIRASRSREL